jgi:hypothetical protein
MVTHLKIRALKPFGFYDDHKKGEVFNVPIGALTDLIQQGLVEIVVNNAGVNEEYDVPQLAWDDDLLPAAELMEPIQMPELTPEEEDSDYLLGHLWDLEEELDEIARRYTEDKPDIVIGVNVNRSEPSITYTIKKRKKS